MPGRADEHGWRRMHMITPALKSWKIIVAFVLFMTQTRFDDFVSHRFDPGYVDQPRFPGQFFEAFLIQIAVFAGMLALGTVWAVLSWRMTKYRLQGDTVQMQSGVLFRQQRRARLDRLQAVDINQPLLARVFGLSEVKIEVAGGTGADIELSYLANADAQQVRRTLLARAAGLSYDEDQGAPEAPQHLVYRLETDRLVKSVLLGTGPVSIVIAAALLALALLVMDMPAGVPIVLPMLLGAIGATWAGFAGRYGFEVAASQDGVRLGYGLLDRRKQTVPPGRVQALQIHQPVLWRWPGWWQIRINVAGYGLLKPNEGGNILAPVVTQDEASQIVALIVADLGTPNPMEVFSAGLVGTGHDGGYTPAPARSRWLDLISWRRNGFCLTDTVLLARAGRLTRRLILVPHAKVQSLGLSQGPLQRLLRLASVAVHSTPGPANPRVEHLSVADAAWLMSTEEVRSRQARAVAGPVRWMTDSQ
ncbi:MAG: hypothetical protein CSB46_07375 [Micrococcales bacterium]|nr:MAG: hypothetical protein CSB46_07375 [Micrococcales bacterium]